MVIHSSFLTNLSDIWQTFRAGVRETKVALKYTALPKYLNYAGGVLAGALSLETAYKAYHCFHSYDFHKTCVTALQVCEREYNKPAYWYHDCLVARQKEIPSGCEWSYTQNQYSKIEALRWGIGMAGATVVLGAATFYLIKRGLKSNVGVLPLYKKE